MRIKNTVKKPHIVISVSHAGLYFGTWSDKLDELRGKTVVVMNTKQGKIVGAFEVVDIPKPIKQVCPICLGKGRVEIGNARQS